MTYARIEPAVLQIELHPYLSQEPLLKLAHATGMAVTAYSSFGPQSYIEIGMGKGVPSLLEHEVVEKIAQANGKSTCLHVLMCHGVTYCALRSNCANSSPLGDSKERRCDPQKQ